MNASIYRFTLDVHSAQSQICLPVMLNDTARKFYISLSEGGKLYHIADGCLALVRINRPTGTYIEQFCAVEDNISIVYDFAQYIYTATVEGLHECEVTLYGIDGGVLTTAKFTMIVSARAVNKETANVTDENWTMLDSIAAAEANRQVVFANTIAETEAATADVRACIDDFEARFRARIVNISVPAYAWSGGDHMYSQVVAVEGVTARTQVDLTPSAEQLAIFHEKDLAFVTENVDGVVTIYAIGDKPLYDYVIQATLTEVRS